MAKYFSASAVAFYDTNIVDQNNLPEDSVLLTDEEYNDLMAHQCSGCVIVAGADGRPVAMQQICEPCSCLEHDETIATVEKLGHIKVGEGLKVAEDGTISVQEGIGGSSRNIGELVHSIIPLEDAGLHLLDGTSLQVGGVYDAFITYVANLQSTYPQIFLTEEEWKTQITAYGSCGKFVYVEGEYLRLPKVSDIIQGTTDISRCGALIEAGLPEIAGVLSLQKAGEQINEKSGAFSDSSTTSATYAAHQGATHQAQLVIDFKASRSNGIYGASTTVQPQTIQGLLYIVVATSTKTDIQIDIDNVITDLDNKADRDLSNAEPSQSFIERSVGWGMPDYSAGITKSTNTTYTAETDGLLIVEASDPSTSQYTFILTVNDAKVVNGVVKTGNRHIIPIFVSKGDVYAMSGTATISAKFYPLKGVSA